MLLFHLLDFVLFLKCLSSLLITAFEHFILTMCCLHNGGEKEILLSVHLLYPWAVENQEDGIQQMIKLSKTIKVSMSY